MSNGSRARWIALGVVCAGSLMNVLDTTIARPQLPLAAFAAELRDARRLDALDGEDPASNLRAVLSWSCQHLSERAAGLFRLLGIHPGPDISLAAAAGLAGSELTDASAALRELTALNLVIEHRLGRYIVHDLLRAN